MIYKNKKMKKYTTTFEEFLNESWISNFKSNLRDLEKRTNAIQKKSVKLDDDEMQNLAEKMENKILNVYDNAVQQYVIDVLVFGSKFKQNDIESLGEYINRNFGTESHMIINAYNDALDFLEREL
jgi:hypothetical protein